VARLVPFKRLYTPAERRVIIERWMSRADKPSLGGIKIHDLISEGRR
jgi:hypothetical protein